MSKQTYISTLLKLFRQFGYEGVTLSKISQETGLGKASLYHHFPGGKAKMAEAALSDVNRLLETNILQPLADATVEIENDVTLAIDAFESMCEKTSDFFNHGENSCLLAVLGMEESSNNLFQAQIRDTFTHWIEAIANVLIAAGLDEKLARQRGEDAIIAIEGALILSHSLGDSSLFQRVIKELPQQICQDL